MSVPDRFHISWDNLARIYTLVPSIAAESAYPLANLQNQVANEWAAFDMKSETTLTLTWSGDVARTVGCLALHNHNVPDGTTIRGRFYPEESLAGEPFDTGALDVRTNIGFGSLIAGYDPIEIDFESLGHLKWHFSTWFPNVPHKSGQIDIVCEEGFVNDTLLIDKLWFGPTFCPAYGPERGFRAPVIEGSEHLRKPGGGMETVQREVRRSLALEFQGESDSERAVMLNIMLGRAKMGSDLLITMDPRNSQNKKWELSSIYRRTSEMSFENAYYNGNALGLLLEEN